jgi:hypothetical protein
MEDELKPPKKKRTKKDAGTDSAKDFEALAKFTSSDVIRQVKAGLSRIAPMEPEGDEAIPHDDNRNDLPY